MTGKATHSAALFRQACEYGEALDRMMSSMASAAGPAGSARDATETAQGIGQDALTLRQWAAWLEADHDMNAEVPAEAFRAGLRVAHTLNTLTVNPLTSSLLWKYGIKPPVVTHLLSSFRQLMKLLSEQEKRPQA